MFRELPLLSGGVRVGRAECEESQLRLRFRCRLPGRQEVCKLWLAGNGSRLLLGTPAPQGGGLYLERSLTRSALTEAGVYPPERVELESVGAASPPPQGETWRSAAQSLPALGDALLDGLFRQGGWRWRRWNGGAVLCHGWAENAPFPAVPLFCLARVERCGAELRVCCWLDEALRPILPPEDGGAE